MTRGRNNNKKINSKSSFVILGWDLTNVSLSRALLATVTVSLLFLSLWARILPQKVDWSVGDKAPRTIIAPRSTVYADTQQTEELRQKAADNVEPVFHPDPEAGREVNAAISNIFAQAAEIRQADSLPGTIDKPQALQNRLAIKLSDKTLRLLVDSPLATLHDAQEAAKTVAGEQMQKAIRDQGDDLHQVQEEVAEQVKRRNLTQTYQAVVTEIVRATIKPNRLFDAKETEGKKDAARQAVSDVQGAIHTGDVIIKIGEQVTPHHIDMFRALGLMNPVIDYTQALAMLTLLAVIVLGLWVFTARFYPQIYLNFNQLALLSLVVVIAAFVFRISQQSAYFEALVLTAACAACMLVALTTEATIAIATAAGLGLLAGLIAAGSDVRLVVTTIICALIASFVITIRGSWSQTIARAAVVLALTNPLLLLLGAETFGLPISWQLMVGASAGGIAAALLAVGATMVAERPLGLLTDLQLMELANPHQPVLRRLLREASGSYQHSVMVGNLAEQAAEAIGANALLARTAAMYHDIGKIKRPYFFVENQFGGDNPHDKLTPYMSALVLIAHDKDGLQMAEQIGLPPALASAIPQHHGTSLISYFYEKALEEAEDSEEVPEQVFRYPGPKPQTGENAIIMLADAVEAAVRTLDDPSPAKIESLVDNLVEDRIQDGQLDESPLTYANVTAIKQSFVATLTSMFHQRVKYPEQLRQEAEELAKRYRPAMPVPARAERTNSSDSANTVNKPSE